MARLLLAYAAALIVAAALGSAVQTQFNLAFIERLGVQVPLTARIETTAADLVGFAPLYGVMVAAAFALAFGIAGLLAPRMAAGHGALYAVAAAASIAAVILLVNSALPMTPVAATRVPAGIAGLALAGAVGGWVYYALRGAPAWRNADGP